VLIAATDDGDKLRIEAALGQIPAELAALEDRVAAIGGELVVSRTAAGVSVRAVLPCGW
jgi:signal transduction histidine kinase